MISHPNRSSPILGVARRIAGDAGTVDAGTMAAILAAIHAEGLADLDNGWGGASLGHAAMRRRVAGIVAARDRAGPSADPPSVRDADLAGTVPTAAELADGWTRWCLEQPATVSVMSPADGGRARAASSNPGSVRYDEPGAIHPLLRVTLMFVPAALAGAVPQLARHARRILVVGNSR